MLLTLKARAYFCNSVNRCVNRCVIVCVNYSFQFIVPKRVARVAKQFTARTIGGVTFFVEDDIENDVFVCGSRWFVYVPGLVVHTHSEGWQPTDDGVVDHWGCIALNVHISSPLPTTSRAMFDKYLEIIQGLRSGSDVGVLIAAEQWRKNVVF